MALTFARFTQRRPSSSSSSAKVASPECILIFTSRCLHIAPHALSLRPCHAFRALRSLTILGTPDSLFAAVAHSDDTPPHSSLVPDAFPQRAARHELFGRRCAPWAGERAASYKWYGLESCVVFSQPYHSSSAFCPRVSNLIQLSSFPCKSTCSFPYLRLADTSSGVAQKSKVTVPKSLDKAMDKQNPSSLNGVDPGISLCNGNADDMEVDSPVVNGAGKRKSRSSAPTKAYKEASGDDDDQPIVSMNEV